MTACGSPRPGARGLNGIEHVSIMRVEEELAHWKRFKEKGRIIEQVPGARAEQMIVTAAVWDQHPRWTATTATCADHASSSNANQKVAADAREPALPCGGVRPRVARGCGRGWRGGCAALATPAPPGVERWLPWVNVRDVKGHKGCWSRDRDLLQSVNYWFLTQTVSEK